MERHGYYAGISKQNNYMLAPSAVNYPLPFESFGSSSTSAIDYQQQNSTPPASASQVLAISSPHQSQSPQIVDLHHQTSNNATSSATVAAVAANLTESVHPKIDANHGATLSKPILPATPPARIINEIQPYNIYPSVNIQQQSPQHQSIQQQQQSQQANPLKHHVTANHIQTATSPTDYSGNYYHHYTKSIDNSANTVLSQYSTNVGGTVSQSQTQSNHRISNSQDIEPIPHMLGKSVNQYPIGHHHTAQAQQQQQQQQQSHQQQQQQQQSSVAHIAPALVQHQPVVGTVLPEINSTAQVLSKFEKRNPLKCYNMKPPAGYHQQVSPVYKEAEPQFTYSKYPSQPYPNYPSAAYEKHSQRVYDESGSTNRATAYVCQSLAPPNSNVLHKPSELYYSGGGGVGATDQPTARFANRGYLMTNANVPYHQQSNTNAYYNPVYRSTNVARSIHPPPGAMDDCSGYLSMQNNVIVRSGGGSTGAYNARCQMPQYSVPAHTTYARSVPAPLHQRHQSAKIDSDILIGSYGDESYYPLYRTAYNGSMYPYDQYDAYDQYPQVSHTISTHPSQHYAGKGSAKVIYGSCSASNLPAYQSAAAVQHHHALSNQQHMLQNEYQRYSCAAVGAAAAAAAASASNSSLSSGYTSNKYLAEQYPTAYGGGQAYAVESNNSDIGLAAEVAKYSAVGNSLYDKRTPAEKIAFVDLEEQINCSKILKTRELPPTTFSSKVDKGQYVYNYNAYNNSYQQVRPAPPSIHDNDSSDHLKKPTLRDFLETWNDDEEEDSGGLDKKHHRKYGNESAMLHRNSALIMPNKLDMAEGAAATPIANIISAPKIHVGITVDNGGNNANNINLPDIIIDIEKPKVVSEDTNAYGGGAVAAVPGAAGAITATAAEKLYVIESIDVPLADLNKYKHLNVVNKLPDNVVQMHNAAAAAAAAATAANATAEEVDAANESEVEKSLKLIEEIELNRVREFKNDFELNVEYEEDKTVTDPPNTPPTTQRESDATQSENRTVANEGPTVTASQVQVIRRTVIEESSASTNNAFILKNETENVTEQVVETTFETEPVERLVSLVDTFVSKNDIENVKAQVVETTVEAKPVERLVSMVDTAISKSETESFTEQLVEALFETKPVERDVCVEDTAISKSDTESFKEQVVETPFETKAVEEHVRVVEETMTCFTPVAVANSTPVAVVSNTPVTSPIASELVRYKCIKKRSKRASITAVVEPKATILTSEQCEERLPKLTIKIYRKPSVSVSSNEDRKPNKSTRKHKSSKKDRELSKSSHVICKQWLSVRTLKSVCVSVINTTEFRRYFAAINNKPHDALGNQHYSEPATTVNEPFNGIIIREENAVYTVVSPNMSYNDASTEPEIDETPMDNVFSGEHDIFAEIPEDTVPIDINNEVESDPKSNYSTDNNDSVSSNDGQNATDSITVALEEMHKSPNTLLSDDNGGAPHSVDAIHDIDDYSCGQVRLTYASHRSPSQSVIVNYADLQKKSVQLQTINAPNVYDNDNAVESRQFDDAKYSSDVRTIKITNVQDNEMAVTDAIEASTMFDESPILEQEIHNTSDCSSQNFISEPSVFVADNANAVVSPKSTSTTTDSTLTDSESSDSEDNQTSSTDVKSPKSEASPALVSTNEEMISETQIEPTDLSTSTRSPNTYAQSTDSVGTESSKPTFESEHQSIENVSVSSQSPSTDADATDSNGMESNQPVGETAHKSFESFEESSAEEKPSECFESNELISITDENEELKEDKVVNSQNAAETDSIQSSQIAQSKEPDHVQTIDDEPLVETPITEIETVKGISNVTILHAPSSMRSDDESDSETNTDESSSNSSSSSSSSSDSSSSSQSDINEDAPMSKSAANYDIKCVDEVVTATVNLVSIAVTNIVATDMSEGTTTETEDLKRDSVMSDVTIDNIATTDECDIREEDNIVTTGVSIPNEDIHIIGDLVDNVLTDVSFTNEIPEDTAEEVTDDIVNNYDESNEISDETIEKNYIADVVNNHENENKDIHEVTEVCIDDIVCNSDDIVSNNDDIVSGNDDINTNNDDSVSSNDKENTTVCDIVEEDNMPVDNVSNNDEKIQTTNVIAEDSEVPTDIVSNNEVNNITGDMPSEIHITSEIVNYSDEEKNIDNIITTVTVNNTDEETDMSQVIAEDNNSPTTSDIIENTDEANKLADDIPDSAVITTDEERNIALNNNSCNPTVDENIAIDTGNTIETDEVSPICQTTKSDQSIDMETESDFVNKRICDETTFSIVETDEAMVETVSNTNAEPIQPLALSADLITEGATNPNTDLKQIQRLPLTDDFITDEDEAMLKPLSNADLKKTDEESQSEAITATDCDDLSKETISDLETDDRFDHKFAANKDQTSVISSVNDASEVSLEDCKDTSSKTSMSGNESNNDNVATDNNSSIDGEKSHQVTSDPVEVTQNETKTIDVTCRYDPVTNTLICPDDTIIQVEDIPLPPEPSSISKFTIEPDHDIVNLHQTIRLEDIPLPDGNAPTPTAIGAVKSDNNKPLAESTEQQVTIPLCTPLSLKQLSLNVVTQNQPDTITTTVPSLSSLCTFVLQSAGHFTDNVEISYICIEDTDSNSLWPGDDTEPIYVCYSDCNDIVGDDAQFDESIDEATEPVVSFSTGNEELTSGSVIEANNNDDNFLIINGDEQSIQYEEIVPVNRHMYKLEMFRKHLQTKYIQKPNYFKTHIINRILKKYLNYQRYIKPHHNLAVARRHNTFVARKPHTIVNSLTQQISSSIVRKPAHSSVMDVVDLTVPIESEVVAICDISNNSLNLLDKNDEDDAHSDNSEKSKSFVETDNDSDESSDGSSEDDEEPQTENNDSSVSISSYGVSKDASECKRISNNNNNNNLNESRAFAKENMHRKQLNSEAIRSDHVTVSISKSVITSKPIRHATITAILRSSGRSNRSSSSSSSESSISSNTTVSSTTTSSSSISSSSGSSTTTGDNRPKTATTSPKRKLTQNRIAAAVAKQNEIDCKKRKMDFGEMLMGINQFYRSPNQSNGGSSVISNSSSSQSSCNDNESSHVSLQLSHSSHSISHSRRTKMTRSNSNATAPDPSDLRARPNRRHSQHSSSSHNSNHSKRNHSHSSNHNHTISTNYSSNTSNSSDGDQHRQFEPLPQTPLQPKTRSHNVYSKDQVKRLIIPRSKIFDGEYTPVSGVVKSPVKDELTMPFVRLIRNVHLDRMAIDLVTEMNTNANARVGGKCNIALRRNSYCKSGLGSRIAIGRNGKGDGASLPSEGSNVNSKTCSRPSRRKR